MSRRGQDNARIAASLPDMNTKKILLPVALLALGIGGFIALKASKPAPPPVSVAEPAWRVETLTVALRPLRPALTLTGQVESPELTRAAAPAAGRIGRVLVREGQALTAGQPLLEMDARDFEPRVAQSRGAVDELHALIRGEAMRHAADLDQLEQERALLGLAAADVARFERLQRENFYSQAAVDQSRSSHARQQLTLRSRELAIADHQARQAQLQARLLQAQANLDQAELALARSRVSAPFDGYVAKVEVAAGDQVGSGQTLLTLYPRRALEVRAKIPAPSQDEILAELARGGRLAASAEVAGQRLAFRLDRVAGAGDARGLDAFFRSETGTPDLRVGSLLSLQLARAPIADAIAIPYTALYAGRQVYRVIDDRLQAVEVTVRGELPDQPARLIVTSAALRPGDRLVVTHLPNAVSGLKVQAAQP
jgi:multidrug efflux pump subunit AcrA (membrane-fusion protein)